MQQHTTQLLLVRVRKCLTDTEYQNYSVPAATGRRTERDGTVGKADAVHVSTAQAFAIIVDNTASKRLARINEQLERMLRGGNITTVQLRSLLTQQQYEDYNASLTAIRDKAELMYGDGMPQELMDYNAILKRGDFAFGKAERMGGMQSVGHRRYRIGAVAKIEHQSQRLYERALERLEEIFSTASCEHKMELQYWMDRDVVFGADGNTGIDCERMPRVRGSKSPNAQDAGLPKLSKRLKRKICVLSALRDAACGIAFVPEKIDGDEMSDAQTLLLSSKLSKLMTKIKR